MQTDCAGDAKKAKKKRLRARKLLDAEHNFHKSEKKGKRKVKKKHRLGIEATGEIFAAGDSSYTLIKEDAYERKLQAMRIPRIRELARTGNSEHQKHSGKEKAIKSKRLSRKKRMNFESVAASTSILVLPSSAPVIIEPEAETETEHEPEFDPASEHESELELAPELEPEPESDSKMTPGLESETESELESDSKPASESEPEPESKPGSEPQPEYELEADPDHKPEQKLEPESKVIEAEPKLKSETESEPEPEHESELEPDPELEIEPEIRLATESGTNHEHESGSEHEPEHEPVSEPEEINTEPCPVYESDLEPEPEEVDVEPEPELKLKPETESDPEHELRPEFEPESCGTVTCEPESEPQLEIEPNPELEAEPESAEPEPEPTQISTQTSESAPELDAEWKSVYLSELVSLIEYALAQELCQENTTTPTLGPEPALILASSPRRPARTPSLEPVYIPDPTPVPASPNPIQGPASALELQPVPSHALECVPAPSEPACVFEPTRTPALFPHPSPELLELVSPHSQTPASLLESIPKCPPVAKKVLIAFRIETNPTPPCSPSTVGLLIPTENSTPKPKKKNKKAPVQGAFINISAYRDLSKANEKLIKAAKNGYVDEVRLLLAWGTDINAVNEKGWSALHIATKSRRNNVARLLIRWGADIEKDNWFGQRPFHAAAGYKNVDVVDLMLEKGRNIDEANHNGDTTLHRAALYEDYEAVQLLLDGASFCGIGWGIGGNSVLAREGADIKCKDQFVTTPLHDAAKNGRKDVVQLLLARGANINDGDIDGINALHWAVVRRHREVVRLLLEFGADIEARSSDGWSALHFAARGGTRDMAQLLLENNANIES
ncbi:hypothetical protein K440DRAFT_679759 [Wilcoxina mikolae CBS 423.85]|nr:hypothetical protein K440DRAFT_679759 [Wilcoxina mikolae CBS 423.85]